MEQTLFISYGRPPVPKKVHLIHYLVKDFNPESLVDSSVGDALLALAPIIHTTDLLRSLISHICTLLISLLAAEYLSHAVPGHCQLSEP